MYFCRMTKLTLNPPVVGRGNGGVVSHFNCMKWRKDIDKRSGSYLPHWEQENVLNFVTFRLADSLPQSKLKELNEERLGWIKEHPKPWSADVNREYDELFHETDKWLDQGIGSCILKYAEIQKIVVDSLHYFDGKEYDLYEYVIMPNHIHLLIVPWERSSADLMAAIKSYTAKMINRFLGSQGAVWQREVWDHLIRSVTEYEEIAHYIRHNPDPIIHLYK